MNPTPDNALLPVELPDERQVAAQLYGAKTDVYVGRMRNSSPPLIIETAGTDEKLRRKVYPELYGDRKRQDQWIFFR